MQKLVVFKLSLFISALALVVIGCNSGKKNHGCIDRQAVVTRHNVTNNTFDTLASLSLGNGAFAYTVDATGMQTFPEFYSKGVSLGTQSDWGWHSFSNDGFFKPEEAIAYFDVHGRQVGYKVQPKEDGRSSLAANYFRVNPHRLHLGIIGLEIIDPDGNHAAVTDINDVEQKLDLWRGIIVSRFVVDGHRVEVHTICHPTADVLSFKIKSDLLTKKRLGVKLRFPYPTGVHTDDACNWSQAQMHQSALIEQKQGSAIVKRTLDATEYSVKVSWAGEATLREKESHYYVLNAVKGNELEVSVGFFDGCCNKVTPTFATTQKEAAKAWEAFWKSGGAIDFEGSTDPRANELERRVVLSQYLTRIQCAGIYPPQETGLTFNSWFGKFHLEMDWWHGVHFALWNRIDLLEKRLGWYQTVVGKAREKALSQGYNGVRWPKMTNPTGDDSPSSIGEFLIWQQPHIIYFAELCYRHHKNDSTLRKYADLVYATADFMASYAHFDTATNRYVLGPALIPAQECFSPETTINPPFELAYWRWGLQTAMEWQRRMGQPINPEWEKVYNGLSPLATDGERYLVAESAPDTYTNAKWQIDHPMILGVYGMLPATEGLDVGVMAKSVDFIKNNWNWDHTWGWDYPMVAMNATRMGQPNWALDALMMDVQKNRYLKNGHNYQDDRLRIYLPGNGGLLTAVAMMCAGYDGNNTVNPGFPADGTWKVRWEGLEAMP
jgi:protein-glucosylgalactosylhydroxylysine glucosidase